MIKRRAEGKGGGGGTRARFAEHEMRTETLDRTRAALGATLKENNAGAFLGAGVAKVD